MSKKTRRRPGRPNEESHDSKLAKFAGKLFMALALVVIILTLAQCTVKKPESPTWDTQLTVPLLNRTYPMTELIAKMDQEGIEIDSNSAIIFSVSENIDTIMLDADELSTDDVSYRALQQVGLVDLAAPTLAPSVLSITQVGGLATYLPGAIPATSFSITPDLPTISNFSMVSIYNGQLYVAVANQLGFAISANSVELWDLVYNRSIGSQSFALPIPDGSADSVLFDLSGEVISNQIQVRITASTAGGTILSTAGKQIITSLRFAGDLTVNGATAAVPHLVRTFEETVELAENDLIYGATISSGSVQIDIANQTNLTATVDITLPDLLLGGLPLTVQRVISPISSRSVIVDLAGSILAPIDSTLPQEMMVEVVADVPGSGSTHIAFDRSDQFMVDVALTNLAFGSVTGVFSTVGTTLEPTQHEIDVPAGFDSIQLVNAMLTLSIDNGIELPGYLTLSLLGNNGKTMTITGPIAPGQTSSVLTQFVDTTVADFLSPLPSVITLSGSAGFGDGVSVGDIEVCDFIHASVDILAPLELIIPETRIDPDIEREEIDPDDVTAVTDHVLEARLIYNVTSHLPLGARVNLYLSNDSATVISNPQVSFIDDIFVTAAPTIGGIASDTASTGYQQLTVTNEDLDVIRNGVVFVGTEIILEDTQGLPVKLTANDYLTITGRIEVEYRFDGDF